MQGHTPAPEVMKFTFKKTSLLIITLYPVSLSELCSAAEKEIFREMMYNYYICDLKLLHKSGVDPENFSGGGGV